MQNWHLIQQQPLLRRIFKDHCLVQKGQILKGYTRASQALTGYYTCMGVAQACDLIIIRVE